jgi:hypothetical protein
MIDMANTLGIVSDIDDPAKAGRIKVTLAEMDGDTYPEWINPVFPSGWVMMPEIGDTVEIIMPDGEDAIEFAEEIRYRGWVLSDVFSVPKEFQTNYPRRRGFKTVAGHLLIFDDTPGSELISLSFKGKHLLNMTTQGIYLGSASASEPLVLGNLWKSGMDSFLTAFVAHTHTTSMGPSGPPDPGSIAGAESVRSGLAGSLSDFVFTQKVKP